MEKKWIYLLAVLASFSFINDKPAYELFNEKGKKTNYKKLLKACL